MDEVRRQLLGDGGGLDADGDVDAGGPQGGDPGAGDQRVGILDADDDPGDAGGHDRRRRTAASARGGCRARACVTSVAPRAASPAAASATRSACGPPGGWVAPVAMIEPSPDTTTAPTQGFGAVLVRTVAAAAMAARMAAVSSTPRRSGQ